MQSDRIFFFAPCLRLLNKLLVIKRNSWSSIRYLERKKHRLGLVKYCTEKNNDDVRFPKIRRIISFAKVERDSKTLRRVKYVAAHLRYEKKKKTTCVFHFDTVTQNYLYCRTKRVFFVHSFRQKIIFHRASQLLIYRNIF